MNGGWLCFWGRWVLSGGPRHGQGCLGSGRGGGGLESRDSRFFRLFLQCTMEPLSLRYVLHASNLQLRPQEVRDPSGLFYTRNSRNFVQPILELQTPLLHKLMVHVSEKLLLWQLWYRRIGQLGLELIVELVKFTISLSDQLSSLDDLNLVGTECLLCQRGNLDNASDLKGRGARIA